MKRCDLSRCEKCTDKPAVVQVNGRRLCLECYDDFVKSAGEMLRSFREGRGRA